MVSQFELEHFRCTLTWFVPLLSVGRQIEAYELQLCCLKGPETKAIQVAEDGKNKKTTNNNKDDDDDDGDVEDNHDDDDRYQDNEQEDDEQYANNHDGDDYNEFFTIRNDLTSNTCMLSNLKPGSRYKARVRAKIREYGRWNPWDRSVVSDMFCMPAAAPDPPFHVRVATRKKKKKEEEEEGNSSGMHDYQSLVVDRSTVIVAGHNDSQVLQDADTHTQHQSHHQHHDHHLSSMMELTNEESMELQLTSSSSINLAPTISEVRKRNNDVDIIGLYQ